MTAACANRAAFLNFQGQSDCRDDHATEADTSAGHPQTAGQYEESGPIVSQHAVTRDMDAAEPEVDDEEAAAEEAGYESLSEEEEEVTWEELHERHSAALTLRPNALHNIPA